jgi:hypothetical protein
LRDVEAHEYRARPSDSSLRILLPTEIHRGQNAYSKTFLLALCFLLCAGFEARNQRPSAPSNPPTPDEVFDAAQFAMGSVEALANIRSISAIAACHSPKSDYETRIVSDRHGNLSFQQFFPDHKNIAGILNGRGWQIGDDSRPESIDASETAVLRGHEFPIIAIDLRNRFHDFKTVGSAKFEGQSAIRVDMIDELGHPAAAYFSPSSHLPEGLSVTNARSGGYTTIRFDSWKLVGDVTLVNHVTIRAGSDTFVFDFKSLILNAAEEKEFEIPKSGMKMNAPN